MPGAARNATGSKAMVLATLPECMPEDVAKRLMAENIVPLKGFDAALELAVAHKTSVGGRDYAPVGAGPLSASLS